MDDSESVGVGATWIQALACSGCRWSRATAKERQVRRDPLGVSHLSRELGCVCAAVTSSRSGGVFGYICLLGEPGQAE